MSTYTDRHAAKDSMIGAMQDTLVKDYQLGDAFSWNHPCQAFSAAAYVIAEQPTTIGLAVATNSRVGNSLKTDRVHALNLDTGQYICGSTTHKYGYQFAVIDRMIRSPQACDACLARYSR